MAASINSQRDDHTLDAAQILQTTNSDSLKSDGAFAGINPDFNDDADPIVYGLEIDPEEIEARKSLHQTLRLIIGGSIAAGLIIGGLMVIKPFGSRNSDGLRNQPVTRREATATQEDEDEEPEKDSDASDDKKEQSEEPQEDQKADDANDNKEPEAQTEEQKPNAVLEPFTASDLGPTVNESDLNKLIHFLSFDGDDLSVPEADMSAKIRGGRVEVFHVLHDIPNANPDTMANNSSRRAAALTNVLADHLVQGADEENPTQFNEVVWRIVNTEGDTYIALSYFKGYAPSSGDPLWVLMQSPYYCMSDSLYKGLGEKVQQRQGEAPKSLNGEAISATASL